MTTNIDELPEALRSQLTKSRADVVRVELRRLMKDGKPRRVDDILVGLWEQGDKSENSIYNRARVTAKLKELVAEGEVMTGGTTRRPTYQMEAENSTDDGEAETEVKVDNKPKADSADKKGKKAA